MRTYQANEIRPQARNTSLQGSFGVPTKEMELLAALRRRDESAFTWMFQILINRAKTRGEREGRMIPFSAMFDPQSDHGEPAVDPSQFNENDPEWPGGWVTQPRNWGANPEQSLLSQEVKAYTQAAIDGLPASQCEVITLRDVQGWTAQEVCNVLGVSETNQRVLLHRARSKVRQALDQYFGAN